MSEIVKNELDAIKAFEDNTEKRRSELTLNELNYISDKQLHKKDSGGGGGGVLVVGMDMQTMALDKTWSEIKNAPFAVLQVLNGNIVQYNSIVSTGYGEDNYYVEFVSITGDGTVIIQFQTNSADGYPVMNMG